MISSLVIAGLDPAIHLFREDGSPGHGASRRPGDDSELIKRIWYHSRAALRPGQGTSNQSQPLEARVAFLADDDVVMDAHNFSKVSDSPIARRSF